MMNPWYIPHAREQMTLFGGMDAAGEEWALRSQLQLHHAVHDIMMCAGRLAVMAPPAAYQRLLLCYSACLAGLSVTPACGQSLHPPSPA